MGSTAQSNRRSSIRRNFMSRSVAKLFYTRSRKFVVRAAFLPATTCTGSTSGGAAQRGADYRARMHARFYSAANITKRPVPAGGKFTHKATAQQAGTHFYPSNDHVDRQHALGPGTKAVGTLLVPTDRGCRGSSPQYPETFEPQPVNFGKKKTRRCNRV